jgi:gluconate 2-dehydrogenase gamma chain
MKRRDSLKAIGLATLGTGLLLDGCRPDAPPVATAPKSAEGAADEVGRQRYEIARDKKLHAATFFTPHEMATITTLVDIIIPKDEKSGSASEAKVPDFIEFIAKDIPEHQLPLRGGLRWLDLQSATRFGKPFVECAAPQQLELVTKIAYPKRATPDMRAGVAFFNRMRDLTATGFFTSKMGMADIGYVGNSPNRWTGVPPDVLKQYGMEQT